MDFDKELFLLVQNSMTEGYSEERLEYLFKNLQGASHALLESHPNREAARILVVQAIERLVATVGGDMHLLNSNKTEH